MASCWIPQLLALEVSTTTRQAQGDSRSSAADPRDELGKSFLGRSSHPWRAPQARHRCRPDFSCQVHGPTPAPTVAGLETVPSKPRRRIASIDLFVVPTSHSGCYTCCWSSDTIGGASCGSASPRIRLPNGSPSKSRSMSLRARHNISSVIGTGSTERHLRAASGDGIRDRPTAPRSWQNCYAEHSSAHCHECLDHLIVFASVICAFCALTRVTTMASEHTCRWPRTRLCVPKTRSGRNGDEALP